MPLTQPSGAGWPVRDRATGLSANGAGFNLSHLVTPFAVASGDLLIFDYYFVQGGSVTTVRYSLGLVTPSVALQAILSDSIVNIYGTVEITGVSGSLIATVAAYFNGAILGPNIGGEVVPPTNILAPFIAGADDIMGGDTITMFGYMASVPAR